MSPSLDSPVSLVIASLGELLHSGSLHFPPGRRGGAWSTGGRGGVWATEGVFGLARGTFHQAGP